MMNVFTVFGEAMVNGRKFYDDHITFSATSFDEAIEIAKSKYFDRKSKDEAWDKAHGGNGVNIIDDFIPTAIMNGYIFQDDVEIRKI